MSLLANDNKGGRGGLRPPGDTLDPGGHMQPQAELVCLPLLLLCPVKLEPTSSNSNSAFKGSEIFTVVVSQPQ